MKKYPCRHVGLEFFDEAKFTFTNSVLVKAKPERLWACLEDASAWPRWADPITNVEWTSPKPFDLGTTRTVSMTGGMTGFEEFIGWETNKLMSFRFNDCNMNTVEAFAERYILTEEGEFTRIEWVMAMNPKGVSKLFLPWSVR